MKKLSIIFWLAIYPLCLLAQIPAGYYDGASGKSGSDLRAALYDKIKGHKDVGYDGLWTVYQTSDTLIRNGTVYVWDMYSARADRSASYYYRPGVGQCGNYSGEGSCYNREHSVPKSWFGDRKPMYSDAFHLVPTDGYVNGRRSNHPFGEVGTASWTSTNGSKLGSAKSGLGTSGTVFEPIDVYKGDFARGYFYMATRYMDQCSTWGGGMFGGENKGFKNWAIQMLLRWHEQDPVSQKEILRNEAIYKAQGNRNPFIDHPEYVAMIWGSGTAPAASLNIQSVALQPAQPKEGDIPAVSATVTASGAILSAVYLKWGTVSNSLKDSVLMNSVAGVYKANLVNQLEGTTVYYAVAAVAGAMRKESSVLSYTVSSTATPPPLQPSGQLFFEDCGETAQARPTVAAYDGWRNYGVYNIQFSGTAQVRDALDNSHVWFAASSSTSLTISGINTQSCDSIRLSFKVAVSSTSSTTNASNVTVTCVDASGQTTNVTVPSQSINAVNSYITVSGLQGIPATSNLTLTFTVANQGAGYRLDDIELTGKQPQDVLQDAVPPVISSMDVFYADDILEASAIVQDASSGVRSVKLYVGDAEGDISKGDYMLEKQEGTDTYYIQEGINIAFSPIYCTFVAFDSAGNRTVSTYVYDHSEEDIDINRLGVVLSDFSSNNGKFSVSATVQNAQQGVSKVWLYLGYTAGDTSLVRYSMAGFGGNYSALVTPNFAYTTLCFTVVVYDKAGGRAEVQHLYTKGGATSVSADGSGFDFLLYPNPASTDLMLQLPDGVVLSKVEIIDMGGVSHFVKEGSALTVNLSSLRQNGIYIVRVTTNKGVGAQLFRLSR